MAQRRNSLTMDGGPIFCQEAAAAAKSALRLYYHNYGPFSAFIHFTLGPLLLTILAPTGIMLMAYMNLSMEDASISAVPTFVERNGGIANLISIIAAKFFPPTTFGLAFVGGYLIFQIILMVAIPGPPSYGLMTPTGHVPKYKNNGMACYMVSMLALGIVTFFMKNLTLMSPTIVVDRYDEILGSCNFLAVTLCIFLYFKGRFFPSTKDSGCTGYPLFDYYWGTELFPRVFGVDMKVLTNCRFGMTLWPLIVSLSWLKNYELFGFRPAMAVATISQMMYLTKFFTWEAGYMKTMDIMVDRAGYYICWGCLCYLPGLYTFPSRYFALRPGVELPLWMLICLVLVAAGCILVQQLAEAEKETARASKGEKGLFGIKPSVINAKYLLTDGTEVESILVTSGFWGISRHFCYLPELLMTFLWSTADGFASALPYFYFFFLTILLANRSYRDDRKCAHKYGQYWAQYVKRVPYRVIPYIW